MSLSSTSSLSTVIKPPTFDGQVSSWKKSAFALTNSVAVIDQTILDAMLATSTSPVEVPQPLEESEAWRSKWLYAVLSSTVSGVALRMVMNAPNRGERTRLLETTQCRVRTLLRVSENDTPLVSTLIEVRTFRQR